MKEYVGFLVMRIIVWHHFVGRKFNSQRRGIRHGSKWPLVGVLGLRHGTASW